MPRCLRVRLGTVRLLMNNHMISDSVPGSNLRYSYIWRPFLGVNARLHRHRMQTVSVFTPVPAIYCKFVDPSDRRQLNKFCSMMRDAALQPVLVVLGKLFAPA